MLFAVEKLSFKSIKHEDIINIGDALNREKDYRSIFIPSYLALSAGLFVSIAASYLFSGFAGSDDVLQMIGAAIFFATLITVSAALLILIRKPANIISIARTPQLIALAATSISGTEHDARHQLEALNTAREKWYENRATFALNLHPAEDSAHINQIWSRIEGDLNLRARGAKKYQTKELRKSAIKASPRTRHVGPSIAILCFLAIVTITVFDRSLENVVIAAISVALLTSSLLLFRKYRSYWVSSGIRRFAINQYFCDESAEALHDCAERIEAAECRAKGVLDPLRLQARLSKSKSAFLSGLAVGSITAITATVADRFSRR